MYGYMISNKNQDDNYQKENTGYGETYDGYQRKTICLYIVYERCIGGQNGVIMWPTGIHCTR